MTAVSAMWRNHSGCRNSFVQVVIILFLLELFTFICDADDHFFPQPQDTFVRKYFPFRKMAIDSKGSNIYIGGKNGILQLDRNFSYLQHYDTESGVAGSWCKNTPITDDYTQVLQLDLLEEFLITCGTVCQGSCYKTNAMNITDRTFYDDWDIVNSNKDKITQSLISNVTYNKDKIGTVVDQVLFVAAPTSDHAMLLISAKNILDKNDFLRPFEPKPNSKVYQIDLKYKPGTKTSITVDKFNFRSIFSDDNFLYFLTTMDEIDNPSRIIKICKTSNFQQGYNSYEDIPITCNAGNKNYKLIQSGQVVDIRNKSVLLVTFTDTTNPGTVVCSYTMDDVLQAFTTARLEFFRCSGKKYNPPYMYNSNVGQACCNGSEHFVGKLCDEVLSEPKYCNWLEPFENIVMDRHPLVSETVLNLPGEYFITGGGRIINDVTEIYLGSSSGNVKKFHMQDPSRVLNDDVVDVIQIGSPVLDIQMRGTDDVFVLSEEKVLKLGKTKCEMAKTCDVCMNLKDARCGWCILSQSCTEYNSQCYGGNFWLPSVQGKCLKAEPAEPGIKLGAIQVKNVKITFIPEINITASEDSWKCVYNRTTEREIVLTSVDLNSEKGCRFEFSDKDEGLKTILIKYGTTTVAETEILFYRCENFKNSCFECNDERAICHWCPKETKCTSSPSSCSGTPSNVTNTKEDCPQIIEQVKSQKIQNNRLKNVTLIGKNLQPGGEYRCHINGNTFQATWIASTEVTCTDVNVNFDGMFSRRDTEIEVTYKGVKIDNKQTIEVYQCQYLRRNSCSICHHLKSSEDYMCTWCDNKCLFNDGSCAAEKQVCSAPLITKVVPKNGPLFGNTSLTITGNELGAEEKDINSLTVSGINCIDVTIHTEIQQITCKTGKSSTKQSGSVKLNVKGKESNKDAIFHYLKPEIKGFSPQRGIRNGNTKLTITGSNLYIGNTDKIVVRLMYGNKLKFTPCQIYRDTLKEETVDNISCRTGKLNSSNLVNMTDLQILYQNGTSEPVEKHQQFSYVENPSISSTKPKNIMNSGGITMTMTGIGFSALTESNVIRNSDNKSTECQKTNDTHIFCVIPDKKKRSVDTGEKQTFTIQLDGFYDSVTIVYVDDPSFDKFGKKTVEWREGETIYLVIQGKNFLLSASKSEYTVTLTSETDTKYCEILAITNTNFTCKVQTEEFGEYTVRVRIGIIYSVEVGTVVVSQSIILYIIIAIVGAVIIITVVLVCVAWRFTVRKKDLKILKLKLEIVKNSQGGFTNMQTTDVNHFLQEGASSGSLPGTPNAIRTRPSAYETLGSGNHEKPNTYDQLHVTGSQNTYAEVSDENLNPHISQTGIDIGDRYEVVDDYHIS